MFDHFIAVDWAQSNMAIARMTGHSDKIRCSESRADIEDLKAYLMSHKGRKILTFEETTTAQWLYVELKPLVDEVIVCDPYRNKLLSEGAKNDRIDAEKLVKLLKSNLLKPVYHSADRLIELRKLVSGYNDLVQHGVRLKNQRSAILRAIGLPKKAPSIQEGMEAFVLKQKDRAIKIYEEDKKLYEQEFERLMRKEITLRRLRQIPGIGAIGAVKILATVVDAKRFSHRNQFLSYCGLVTLEKISGNRSYGKKKVRHRRELKAVFKTAALSAITHDNCFQEEYNALIKECRFPDHKARHAISRRIATAAWGVLKNGNKFSEEIVRERFCMK